MDYCILCLGTVQAATESTTWPDIAQAVTALASLVIAGIALYLTKKQAAEMVSLGAATRKHNRISVRPLIDFHITTKTDRASITVKNCGIGPAIIESVQLKYQEQALQLKQDQLSQFIVSTFATFPYIEQVEINGESVLSQNQELKIIDITPGPRADYVPPEMLATAFKNAGIFINTLEVIINYRCIYGDKYQHHHKIKNNKNSSN